LFSTEYTIIGWTE